MRWLEFLTDYNIEFVTSGQNVKKDNVCVRCPFCGEDDPSTHLGISLVKDAWACWRNALHRGISAHRLIAALIGVTNDAAKALARAYSNPDPSALDQALANLTRTSEAPKPVVGHEVLLYPSEFRPIKPGRFWRYLADRHFDDVADLCDRYQLQCCTTGRWKDRVIIPFYAQGELIGWTARAITPTVNAPRYLSSSETVKKIVFNEDDLMEGGKLLFLTEGPFDALKLDYYGEPYWVRATCCFGVTMTMDQIAILNRLRRRFKKVAILFDHNAIEPAFNALDWLQAPNVTIGSLPDGVKDPGELSREGVGQLMEEYL